NFRRFVIITEHTVNQIEDCFLMAAHQDFKGVSFSLKKPANAFGVADRLRHHLFSFIRLFFQEKVPWRDAWCWLNFSWNPAWRSILTSCLLCKLLNDLFNCRAMCFKRLVASSPSDCIVYAVLLWQRGSSRL